MNEKKITADEQNEHKRENRIWMDFNFAPHKNTLSIFVYARARREKALTSFQVKASVNVLEFMCRHLSVENLVQLTIIITFVCLKR